MHYAKEKSRYYITLSLGTRKNSALGLGPLLTSNISYSHFKLKYPLFVPERLPCTINIHSLIHFCIKSFIPSLQTQTSYAPQCNTTDSRNSRVSAQALGGHIIYCV